MALLSERSSCSFSRFSRPVRCWMLAMRRSRMVAASSLCSSSAIWTL
jgi:hypothetical protein